MIYCKGDYLTCVKDKWMGDYYPYAYGWDAGVGLTWQVVGGVVGQGNGPNIFSHAQYKKAAHSPTAGRFDDHFIMSNLSTLPPGVVPTEVVPAVLHMHTDNPEHKKRRTLMVDMLINIQKTPDPEKTPVKFNEIVAPPGVTNRDGGNYTLIKRTVGFNLFRWMFGVDLSVDQLTMMEEYDGTLALAVMGLFGKENIKGGETLAKIRKEIEGVIIPSNEGQKYIAGANERGMDGLNRLREVIFISMFAGYGGTGGLTTLSVAHLVGDPKNQVPLFFADTKAYMEECARFFPPVNGMNPYKVTDAFKGALSNGKEVDWPVGTFGMMSTSGANRDPAVFKDPNVFKPGRENGDRFMTFNNEYREVNACVSTADCPKAPRGCPGTHMALRLATGVMKFFAEGEKAKLDEAAVSSGQQEL